MLEAAAIALGRITPNAPGSSMTPLITLWWIVDGSFTESEIKKITRQKRLADIVHTNPKRVRRYIYMQ